MNAWSKVKHDHLQSRHDDEGRSDEDVWYWNNTAHDLPLVQSTTQVVLIFLGGLRSIRRVYFSIPMNPYSRRNRQNPKHPTTHDR
jgi:hypothetical protein